MTENKINKLYLKFKPYIPYAILTLMFFINCFCGQFAYVAFAFLLIFILFDDLKNGFSYVIYSLPYCLLYWQNQVRVSTILYFACILIYVVKFYGIYFFKEKGKLDISLLFVMLGLFVYCLLPIGNYNFNVFFKICLFLFLFLAIFMLVRKPDVFDFEKNIKVLAITILISCVMTLTYYISPYLKSVMTLSFGDSSFRFAALFRQTNVLALACEILIAALAYFIIVSKKKVPYIILFVLTAIAGCLTLSKTYLIILCVVLLSLFIWLLKLNWKKTLIITLIFALLVLMAFIIYPKIFFVMYDRFFGGLKDCKTFADVMNIITTHRFDLWVETCTYLVHHPVQFIFGRGLGAPALSSYSAHNAYLSMIYQLGLVGAALFISVLVLLFRMLIKKNKPKAAIAIPIIVLALILCVEDMLFYIL